MKKNSLKEKKILLTGITGFIGSHLEKRLKEFGADVYGISRVREGKKIEKIDVTDFDSLNSFIRHENINFCIHLAAESLVESGQSAPYHTFKANILGALNILECSRENNLERVIIASTSHVYGDNKLPYKEIYTPKPSRPYETSKTCVDLIAQSYSNSFNLPVLIPRFVNIYGPGDLNFNRLIPKTIKSILSDEKPTMWGGNAIRDYLYIDDAISAYICLAKVNLKLIGKNRIFNFGSNNRVDVKNIIERIIKLSEKNLKIERIEDERIAEIKAQFVSWKKAERILNWRPKISLEDGLRQAIDWYKKNLDFTKPLI